MTQHDSEAERMTATYAEFGNDPRKLRAWSRRNPGNTAIREEVTAALLDAAADALRGDGELLDAGCGTGWWLQQLSAAGVAPSRLHGVDLIEARAASAARAVPGASVQVGDVRSLPHPDGRFAAVFSLLVLSTLPDAAAVEQAVREEWRVLAPGGVLVIWDARVPTPGNRSTRLVRPREIAAATGVSPHGPTLTVVPPLARRLGGATERWYPRLSRVPALRTHRLYVAQRVH